MPNEPDLVLVDDPNDGDRLTLLARLREFNDTQVGPLDLQPVAILLKTDGVTVGGCGAERPMTGCSSNI